MDSPPNPDAAPEPALHVRQGTNQGGMRQSNERVILTLLRRKPGLPKAEIARQTGLSAQTVARLIGSLSADGLISHGAPQKGRVGQPSVPLSLNPDGVAFYGLKVGRRSVELVVTDFVGAILDREKQVYDYPDFDAVLRFAQSAAATLKRRLPKPMQDRIGGMGIAMPFHLWNWASQIGVSPSQMADWQHRDLQAEVGAALDLPVFLQNDATAAASAEIVFGTDPLPENALCFYIAFFIGAGLSLGGTLFTGSTGNAAGFGPLHVPDLDGRPSSLIELASLATLERALRADGRDPLQIWTQPDSWDMPVDIQNAWIAEAAHGIAHAIHAAQTILDLGAVQIDGWLPRDMLLSLTAAVQDTLNQIDMTGMNRPDIRAGTVGADARLLGAASLPLTHRFLTA